MEPKPAVILDLDGVLRDSSRASFAGTSAALRSIGLEPDFSVGDYWRLRGFKEFNNKDKALSAAYSVAVSGKRLAALLKSAPRSIAALVKLYPTPPGVLENMNGVRGPVVHQIIVRSPACPGGLRGLSKLSRIARLAVVSDAARWDVEEWLRRRGLARRFAVVLGREDVPERKPSPKALMPALQALGEKPRGAFYVGDAESDMAAAKAAGMVPIGVLGGMASGKMLRRAGAEKVFGSLNEFADWLKKT